MSAIAWHESETDEEAISTYLAGYTAEVGPCREDASFEWFWRVDATSEVSEWPEVFNCGFAETLSDAIERAEKSLRKAVMQEVH